MKVMNELKFIETRWKSKIIREHSCEVSNIIFTVFFFYEKIIVNDFTMSNSVT